MTRDDFLPLAKPCSSQEEVREVLAVLESGWWTTGPKVFEFEKALCAYLQDDEPLYAVGLNSCTAALHLSLLAKNIGPGDEVILPTWTFAATAQVVEWVGATPVLCDVMPDDLTISPEIVASLVNEKTKAIMPVHIAGFPYRIAEIQELAAQHDLTVIDDAAHAIGTSYRGKKVGNFADITCFSFYATKNLAMGEGGAAVSKDQEVIERIRKLGYFGINKEAFKRYEKFGTWFYDIEELGYKYNLDSMHAALGLAQLKRLEDMNRRRRHIAQRYRNELSGRLQFTKDSQDCYHIYHLFMMMLPEDLERDAFIEKMRAANIGTSVHFIPLHRHTHYRKQTRNMKFPVADKIFEQIVSIPIFPSMTESDVDYVIDNVNRIVG